MVEAQIREIETLPIDRPSRCRPRRRRSVDLRDSANCSARAVVRGAFHCPRGMLEFWIDPDSPYHKPVFAAGQEFVFFCAGGLRSALAAKTAQDMGLKPVAHIEGGFGAWKKAGGPVAAYVEKTKT